MNCASTSCNTVTALPSPSLAIAAPLQRMLNGVVQTAARVTGWWQSQLTIAPALPAITTRDLSDHVLRDIGFLDSLPPRKDARRHTDY